MYKGLLLVALFVASSLALAPLLKSVEPIEDSYIVVFKENITKADLTSALTMFSTIHAVEYDYTYGAAIKGFAAKMNAAQVFAAQSHPDVDFIEQNQVMRALQCQGSNAAPWGLQRIWQQESPVYNNQYNFPTAASDVNAYIIDTGIYLAHNDFQTRAIFGFKSQASWSNTDANGHGTHVASTVGGIAYGVAKGVTLIAVKVLGDNGSGTTAGVIAGVDWTLTHHLGTGRRSVANMSLGGGYSQALNNAVDATSLGGCPVVVAAGNSNADACNYSPASAPNSICTGSTARTGTADTRSTFSNYGDCLHVFAPGTGILGAWIGSPAATNTISGTSMASPHVCGVAALISSMHPSYSFTAIRNEINRISTKEVIALGCGNAACNRSPNELVHNDC